MPKNRFIYVGVLVVAAVALIYLGYEFTKFVQPILPYALGVGALLIVFGMFMEARKGKTEALKPSETSAENIRETTV
jgi:undecaprenyl pyrophosphate phosphatase UppP